MPFSSLKSPADIQRAHAAVDAAWQLLSREMRAAPTVRDQVRLRLAYIVAGLMQGGQAESDLAVSAVAKLRDTADPDWFG